MTNTTMPQNTFSKRAGSLTLIAITLFVLGLAIWQLIPDSTDTSNPDVTNVRLGWQIPWATQGQLAQIINNTDIAKDNNLEVELKGFSFGGPLNEAALANEVDVLFTADQPAATLLTKDEDWTIIARLMYNRVSLYVPLNSPIDSVSDLKGKTVAMPFGAAAQRMALAEEEKAGLNTKTDVNNINLGIYEQSDIVKDPNVTTWGDIDAMAGFDPTPAIFEQKGLIKNLHVGKIVSVVMMSNSFIEENPDAPERFLRTFYESYDFYRLNEEQANDWFISESNLDITSEALETASSIEPNIHVGEKEEMRLDFTEEDLAIMQEAADFIYDQDLVDKRINMEKFIDLTYLNKILN